MTHKKIVQFKVHEDETVEIKWLLKDNTVFYQRIGIPPKATREARHDEQISVRREDESKT